MASSSKPISVGNTQVVMGLEILVFIFSQFAHFGAEFFKQVAKWPLISPRKGAAGAEVRLPALGASAARFPR